MKTMQRKTLLLAAAFVAATLIGSRLPEDAAWEGARTASADGEEFRPWADSAEDGGVPGCEGEAARA